MKRNSKIALAVISIILLLFITTDGMITASKGKDPFEDMFLMDMFKGFLGKFEDKLKFLKDPPIFPGLSKQSNSIVVTLAPSNTDWSEIDKKDSICNLPEGKMSAGDVVTDCSGTVILVYKPAVQTLGIWEFGGSGKNAEANDPIEDEKENIDEEPDSEKINPEIKITKPEENAFYFLNQKKLNSGFTKIVGNIDIEAVIENPSNVNISHVKFYINDEYMYKDETKPYIWNWNQRLINKHCSIKVVASDNNLNEITEDEMTVVITNLGLL